MAVPLSRTPTRSRAGLAGLLALVVVGGCGPSGSGAVAAAVGTPDLVPVVAVAPGGPTEVTATIPPKSIATPVASAAAAPTPTPAPTPIPTATPSPSPTPDGPHAMNLYRKGDFVTQANKHQCVAAAMQIMLDIVGPKNDRRVSTQTTLATLARKLSRASNGGTEPEGWARGLERRGAGDYTVAVAPTVGSAVRRAIEAIRTTGRPVGLLVWRGAHSWVLHGFETTADPATSDDWKVTAIWVSDPWYPRISSIWGPSRKPNQRITVKQLREDYLKWRRPTGRYPGKDGKYVMVLPV
jgi:hypothetical protein